ncbi:DUF3833 family protein [Pseudomonas sp. FW215-R2]|nr:DUF3833 family protein [Pseudomonas sp. FW215-R2]
MQLQQVDVHTYSHETPTLELREFFEGRVEAWGLLMAPPNALDLRLVGFYEARSDSLRLSIPWYLTRPF